MQTEGLYLNYLHLNVKASTRVLEISPVISSLENTL